MIRYIMGWIDRRTGKSGWYSTTYKTAEEARKARDKKNDKHHWRAHGIVPKEGSDGS